MPKPISRRKTKKSAAQRFKVTGSGTILFGKPGRRHLASSKNRKRMRRLGKIAVLDKTDMARILENLPFR